ncbi:MAG: tRNA(Ile)-lysidine synthetase [Pseudomonadota bacterium]|jgi:tRNA(Ile)-lysidine synthetase-like protein
MRLERTEFEILQQLRMIPQLTRGICAVHVLVSGGKDSVALLQLLSAIQNLPRDWSKVSFRLFVHHFNHHQRGAESDGDEELCIDLVRKSGAPLKVWQWPAELTQRVENGENFQELARHWRYFSVRSFAEGQGQHWGTDDWLIATAHHRRDHAETVLHNLTRGCGKRGLLGLTPWNDKEKLLRPLLWLSAAQSDKYIANKSWPHREDSSNAELHYTRNRLRNIVMRELEALNPQFIEHLWNLSADVGMTAVMPIDEAVQEKTDGDFGELRLLLNPLMTENDLHRFITRHIPAHLPHPSRRFLTNILDHINKCLSSPQIPRQYKFALSESVWLHLTHKHLELKVTQG